MFRRLGVLLCLALAAPVAVVAAIAWTFSDVDPFQDWR